jgi:glycosyltransferase involved in cell wall biosynthesis
MKDSPLVSIIISNYNYGRFLKPCIESVLDQAYPHIEVIVVDDGSTDNSREIIASYGNRLVPVLKENGGQASALNVGFSISHGKIVIFLEALYCLDIPEVGLNDLIFLAYRTISLKLDRLNHPFNKNLLSIGMRGIKSAVIFPEIHGYRKLIYALWFVGMLIPQKSISQALARNFVVRKKRG